LKKYSLNASANASCARPIAARRHTTIKGLRAPSYLSGGQKLEKETRLVNWGRWKTHLFWKIGGAKFIRRNVTESAAELPMSTQRSHPKGRMQRPWRLPQANLRILVLISTQAKLTETGRKTNRE